MGRVANSLSQPNKNSRRLILCAVVAALVLFAALPVWSQSGRQKEAGKKPAPRPTADPDGRGSPSSPSAPSKTVTDEVDANDVVRISSNLVPIPVSVIDKRG